MRVAEEPMELDPFGVHAMVQDPMHLEPMELDQIELDLMDLDPMA